MNIDRINTRYDKFETQFIENNNVRVLSTLDYHKSVFWQNFCTTLDVSQERGYRRIIKIVFYAMKLRHTYDRLFVTGGEKTDLIAVMILSFIPWVNKSVVIVDAHWQKKKGLLGLFQTFVLFTSKRILIRVQVHSREEEKIYPDIFPIDKSIIQVIPFSTSLMGYQIEVLNEGFMLSGGVSFRDYSPLLSIIDDIPLPVKLGIPGGLSDEYKSHKQKQSNKIKVFESWSNSEYFSQMSKCEIFLMPLKSNLNRTAGDQTILNAMLMRKVVIISDSITARTYIKHGVNGLIYSNDDPESLLHMINYWLSLDEEGKNTLLDNAFFAVNTRYSERRRLLKTALLGVS